MFRILSPFMPASRNDWSVEQTAEELDAYVELFSKLKEFLTSADRCRSRAL